MMHLVSKTYSPITQAAKTLLPLAFVLSLSGCLSISKPIPAKTVNIPIMSKEVIISSRIKEDKAIEEIVEELNRPTSIAGQLMKKQYRKYRVQGGVNGTKTEYIYRGVEIKHNTGKPNIINYTYYDTLYEYDSRSKKYGFSYRNWHWGVRNFLRFNLTITDKGDSKHYLISTTESGYSVKKYEGIYGKKNPLSKQEIVQDVQERLDNMNVQIPAKRYYEGEVTLKNNDVTAFANIQRNFDDSFVSTNDKDDSKKFGSFKLSNGQLVKFKLFPYKSVAKLQYEFEYLYHYNGKGGSDFDTGYEKRTVQQIAREFNR